MRKGKVPLYYTEAHTIITAVLDAKYYAQATPFPLLILNNQAPLQWIKTCSKGRVTAWRIEQLWDIRYTVVYHPGSWNVVADVLSRYAMLGPERLARIGIESALESLCNSLTGDAKTEQIMGLGWKRHTSDVAGTPRMEKPKESNCEHRYKGDINSGEM